MKQRIFFFLFMYTVVNRKKKVQFHVGHFVLFFAFHFIFIFFCPKEIFYSSKHIFIYIRWMSGNVWRLVGEWWCTRQKVYLKYLLYVSKKMRTNRSLPRFLYFPMILHIQEIFITLKITPWQYTQKTNRYVYIFMKKKINK